MNLKPTAFMKQDVLDTLHAQDCFFAFASKGKNVDVPLFTWEQVKSMILKSKEYHDPAYLIQDIEESLK